MTDAEIFEATFQTILRDTKLTYWKRLQLNFEWAYSEAYHSVLNSQVLQDQRGFKILDDRFYLSEKAFQTAAKEGGLIASGEKITVNNWTYTLVRGGGVCMVQSYVQTPDEMARPSKFRDTLAAINGFINAPQLPFTGVDPTIYDVSKMNAVIIHGPVGKAFSEGDQELAFLNFAVPDKTCSVWGINIPVTDIIARFESVEAGVEISQRDIAQPRIRRPAAKKEEKAG